MKLNERHITSIVKEKDVINYITNCQKNQIREDPNCPDNSDEMIEKTFNQLLSLKSKRMILRKTVQQMIERIKLSENFHPKFLINIPKENIEIILNESQLYKFYVDEAGWVHAIFIEKNKDYQIGYVSFSFHPATANRGTSAAVDMEVLDYHSEQLVRILIFLYHSDITTIILKPKNKVGTLHTERFKNELKDDFIIVDSSWNQISIRNEGFSVSGHFRLQPCGVNNEDRKLIFIDEFQKHGYIRGSKKLQEQENLQEQNAQ